MTQASAANRYQLFAGTLLAIYGATVALAPSLPLKLVLAAPLAIAPLLWWLLNGYERWLLLFFPVAWLLPPLPFALGNSGPHIAVLVAGVGLFLGLLRLPTWRLHMDAPSWAMLALSCAMTCSLLPALLYSGPHVAAGSLARVLLFAISIYIFFFVRNGPTPDSIRLARWMFFAAAGSALFACVDFYYQFPAPAGYGAQFIWLDSGVFRRAQGFFYEASTLGNFCAFFLAMIPVALFKRRDLRICSDFTLLGGGAVLSAALVLSYSRGSLINLVIAMLAAAWLERSRITVMRSGVSAVLAIALPAAILAIVFRSFLFAYLTRLMLSAQFFFESPNGVLSGRLQSWQLLTDFLVANPWHALLGIGYKTLPYSDFIGVAAVADNTYLGMLLETGIAGLASLLALNVAILTTGWRGAQSADPRRSFFGTWIFCFWSGEIVQMMSGDLLTYWRVLPAYFCVLALAARD